MGWSNYLPSPVILTLGPVSVHWYGVLLALGVYAGYLLVRPSWRQSGRTVAELEQFILWLLIGGLVGARVLDVFVFEWGYFQSHLSEMWQLWRGGLAWHGGLFVASLVAWRFGRRHGLSLYQLGDLLAPGLALGQAIGRWGNYFNQELFGLPTNLPWGIPIVESLRPPAYLAFTHFHPTFLYESLGLLLIALLLWYVRTASWPTGRRLAVYLLMSGVLRFLLEFLRIDDQLTPWGVRVGFITAGVVILIGALVWWRSNRVPASHSA